MTNKFKYFIGNWKMFGDISSLKILYSINNYIRKINTNNNKIVFCVPNTLISYFSSTLKKTNIIIGAQNCHSSDMHGPFTGSVNSRMIKAVGAKYVILGHSENRSQEHDKENSDTMINRKVKSALKNNLVVIFCIGETLIERKKKLTNKILSQQIYKGLKSINNLKKVIIAYEPVWSIGTGITPSHKNLTETILLIRENLVKKFKNRYPIKVIYGGSVNPQNISKLNDIKGINGFLVGGASQSSKNFIDIIKNYYK
jgi:triosephosphate isomerase